ncbi:hypothetical protein ICE98_02960 [Lactococcus lactis]|nr:hypothetical protein [Lactococcus lactis]
MITKIKSCKNLMLSVLDMINVQQTMLYDLMMEQGRSNMNPFCTVDDFNDAMAPIKGR